MPAKSKEQQRLFGWVHAVQKGECKDAPEKIKDIADSISKKDAKEFAETKHKGLPEKVKHKKKMDESKIQITESDIRRMVRSCVNEVLENWEADVEKRKEDRGLFADLKTKLEGTASRCGWDIVDMYKSSPTAFTLVVSPNEEGRRVAEIALLASAASDALGKRVMPRGLKNEVDPKTGTHFLEIEI